MFLRGFVERQAGYAEQIARLARRDPVLTAALEILRRKLPHPPLTFFWPKVGHIVHFWEVQWRPGPGVDKNIGWFSKTLEDWPNVVRDTLDGLQ